MIDEINKIIEDQRRPKLLLHSCCAPCSSFVLQYLSQFFEIEVYFFNPNIHPEKEYLRRLKEQIRLVDEMGSSRCESSNPQLVGNGLTYQVIDSGHQSHLFYESIKGYEKLGEGSERCFKCFELRLEATAMYAKAHDFDYFSTTLTISPMKNAAKLNELGLLAEAKHGIKYLQSDFKKNNGYKTSVELSKKYDLYRQHYCGCAFSMGDLAKQSSTSGIKKESQERLKKREESKCETCQG